MGHCAILSRAMPMLDARREPDKIASTHLLSLTSPFLHQTPTVQNNQELTVRMRVPVCSRTGLEHDETCG